MHWIKWFLQCGIFLSLYVGVSLIYFRLEIPYFKLREQDFTIIKLKNLTKADEL